MRYISARVTVTVSFETTSDVVFASDIVEGLQLGVVHSNAEVDHADVVMEDDIEVLDDYDPEGRKQDEDDAEPFDKGADDEER